MVGSWVGSVAKALTAFAIVLIVGLVTSKGYIVDDNVIDAILTALGIAVPVWAVPNRPYPTDTRHVA